MSKMQDVSSDSYIQRLKVALDQSNTRESELRIELARLKAEVEQAWAINAELRRSCGDAVTQRNEALADLASRCKENEELKERLRNLIGDFDGQEEPKRTEAEA